MLKFQHHFEWDSKKARENILKHGISFERAASVFLDAEALSLYDSSHSHKEERWITLGVDRSGNLLVVCHTFREESARAARIRIFSARKATKNERRQYRGKI